ncbi:MAG: class I SAM-dependent methyltransferase [Dehalococcoidales bacterium]|nr:class I SAM-dependent methyltransferase [Dehalococcoidales bacterium]
MVLNKEQDALGQQFYDYLINGESMGIVERSDGYIGDSGQNAVYFGKYKTWPSVEKKSIRFARGRVLDIGVGAGRHALYLQDKGLDVTGLDNSPLALEVCRRRGLEKTVCMSFDRIDTSVGIFDTVIMFGNNFGLFGSYRRAKRLLKKLHTLTSKKARIIAITTDVYQTDDPVHLAYQENNRKRGRMSGQIKLRVRYKSMKSPWFDYLMVSKEELEDILEGTGWEVARYIDISGDPHYGMVLEKTKTGVRK